ncbi:MAG: histidine kinase, partial [Phaeodactylibacter sp.]|nr:histidine kinase [Phaeodactylibacter sp.]
QLRASNAAGEWTDTNIVSLPVKIIPAFWQTWWFRLLALTALLGTGFWLYFYRQLQQSRRQALKAEYEQQLSRLELSALRAQMNPHFIFNAFNSVKWYLIKGEREKTVDYLDKFSLLIRKVLESTRHEVVPLSEELETIRLMLEIEQMRFKNKFEYCIEVDENIDTQFLRVPPLILQPYVENAIWHGLLHKAGAPGRLTISLASIPGGVRCIIEDNGIGREKAKTLRSHSFRHTRSYGMQIGKERIALLSRQYFQAATLEVEDLTDETGQAAGTRVTVDLCP